MKCARCYNSNVDQARFCSLCGAELDATASPKRPEPKIQQDAREVASVPTEPYSYAGRNLCCPHCCEKPYTEDTGEVECRKCSESFNIREDGTPVGLSVTCPHCDKRFYTEEAESIDCPECSESFSIREDGTPVGLRVVCPHCDKKFYSEEEESIDCPECSESFTIRRHERTR